jgi:hypothetical protein
MGSRENTGDEGWRCRRTNTRCGAGASPSTTREKSVQQLPLVLIEARYNRAVALARLGRREEAMRALEPFAAGEYGEYRREDARRIIENLKH